MTNTTTTLTDVTIERTVLVIADRGHVWVAKSYREEGHWLFLMNARCVRTWGTSKGLNELVNGPTTNTVLDDPAPVLMLNMPAVIAIIPCQDAPWDEYLKGGGFYG